MHSEQNLNIFVIRSQYIKIILHCTCFVHYLQCNLLFNLFICFTIKLILCPIDRTNMKMKVKQRCCTKRVFCFSSFVIPLSFLFCLLIVLLSLSFACLYEKLITNTLELTFCVLQQDGML